MKIVINRCFGGFGLSPLALKRYAELKGLGCYFFETNYSGNTSQLIPISLEEANNNPFFHAFTVNELPNPIPNEFYKQYAICDHDLERTDPNLIKVVKELKDKANGSCAKLKIVTIPDGTEWEISDYDGMESVEEVHKSWY